MSNLRVFTLPAGTRLQSDCMGDTLRADVVMVCDERDAWLLRAVMGAHAELLKKGGGNLPPEAPCAVPVLSPKRPLSPGNAVEAMVDELDLHEVCHA